MESCFPDFNQYFKLNIRMIIYLNSYYEKKDMKKILILTTNKQKLKYMKNYYLVPINHKYSRIDFLHCVRWKTWR